MKKLRNIHPGEVLQEDFFVPYSLSEYKVAKDLGISRTRLSEILKCERRVTADTAIRLSKYFGTTAKFWLNIQDDFDIEKEQQIKSRELDLIEPLSKQRN